jgi:uncharacterized metal-binding protein
VNLVIDGCPVDCAKKVFEQAGIKGYRYLRVTDLGIDKTKGACCSRQQIDQVMSKAREMLAAS